MSEFEVLLLMNKQPSDKKPPVIFVPGIVTPADLSYGPLLGVIGSQIQPILKDLEVYAHDAPPVDYGLELEVEGIRHVADLASLKRFHLVGFSGGAASSLAFTEKYPERLNSLALIEPPWIGSVAPEDADDWAELEQYMSLPPEESMRAFIRWTMLPGVEPPALGMLTVPPPPWMAKRPAGIVAMSLAFTPYHLDQNRFRLFTGPVYYALGSLSNRFFEHEAKILSGLFPYMQVEEYEGRSHFDPPHRAEPERFGRALLELWARAEAA
jgi:pimeloyl-ACP methyl ester carboxylesterase